jgi:hypothetical protein
MSKEKACMEEDIMMEKCDQERDPKLDASFEALGMLSRMLDHFSWMGIQNMDPDQAESRQEMIKMKIAFIRTAAELLEPALGYVEEYVDMLMNSDSAEDSLEGEND